VVADTAFCTGPVTITPTNNSTGGSSYLWDFGDGNTSSIFEPSYTYNTNGFYILSLIADGGICGSDISTVQIQIGAESPVVSDTSACGSASFLLTASGSNLSWYDAATSGNLLTTGNTYNTPILSNSTTYYVCSSITNSYTGGKPDNTGTGGYFTNTTIHGIIFNCYSPVKLKTVTIYAGAAGSRTFVLQNSAGTTLDQITVNLAAGDSTVTLNFDIPVGTNLKLLGPASPNLYRNGSTSGPNLYPYMVGDAIEMVQSTASGYETQFYYYFYNWEIEQTCQSAMVPLLVNVFDVPATSFTFSANYLDVAFTNASTGSGSYLWDFGDGNTSILENPNHIYAAAGTYWVVLTQTNSCGTDVDSLEVIVDVNTGIENENVVARVFPNPANNNVTIGSATEMLCVDLFDATGKLMYSEASNSKSTTINVAMFASGLYYIRITTADGVTNKPLTIE
jgi:PKD repeat protein